MLPFIIAFVFMLALGKKLMVPDRWLVVLSVVLLLCYLTTSLSAIPVLITLFVAAPFLIPIRYSDKAHALFGLCVVLPLVGELIY
ncbi:hypothetical protein [Vibrio sp. H11]|uniref:hypothetical protein n=1 Tax=Vibrio sp. H11 TaxID=2565928 RepID=UPI0010A5FEB5|nr:hypothetical protein [Vibrio sp. H11]